MASSLRETISISIQSVMTSGGSEFVNMDGDVKGWNIGGDLWLRVPLAKDLSVPMLVKVDYQKKTRDGDGPGNAVLGFSGYQF